MTIKNIAPALARIALIIGLGFATALASGDVDPESERTIFNLPRL